MDSKTERKRTIHHVERPYDKPIMVSSFTVIDELQQSSHHSHSVYKVRKTAPNLLTNVPESLIPQRYKNTWFLKKDDCISSVAEVFAQECFRLFIPNQQKTRLVKTDGKPNLNVLSKEILGFTPFKDIDIHCLKECLLNGIYYGLGAVLLISLLLAESDLHEGNIGINAEGQVVKIDGGLCFSHRWYDSRNYHITEKDLQTLPLITDYEAHNWLGDALKNYGHECSIDVEIRHEINAAILRALVLPAKMIKKCALDCVPSSLGIMEDPEQTDVKGLIEQLYADLLIRRLELKKVALKNKSFTTYLLSDEAKIDLVYYLDYLKNYKTVNKRGLAVEDFEKHIFNNFNTMQVKISNESVHSNRFFKPQNQENHNPDDYKLQLRPRK